MSEQKQITAGLAVLMVVPLLAGCGSHQEAKPASSSTSTSQQVVMSSPSRGQSTSGNAATGSSAKSSGPTVSSVAKEGIPENAVIKRPNQAIALYTHAMAIPNDPGCFTATQVAGGWRVTDTSSGISGQVNFDGSEPDSNGGTIPYSKLSAPDHLGDFQLPAPK